VWALLLTAALSLAVVPAGVRADPGGGKGDDKEQRGRPSPRVQGRYVLRFAGYYTGTGEARANGSGIKISARLKDPKGKEYDFQAKKLDIDEDRFSGTGLLDGKELDIDGRIDPQDKRGNEVLKKGRMTFTFSVDGHHSRGVGDQRDATTGS
jgi:hypothetical protein